MKIEYPVNRDGNSTAALCGIAPLGNNEFQSKRDPPLKFALKIPYKPKNTRFLGPFYFKFH